MTVHLMKVAAGAQAPEDLARWQATLKAKGRVTHTTRMWPKREAEILDGGSIYWSVAKKFSLRQRILGLERCVVAGTPKCRLVLDPELVPVRPAPRRPFQGWRYLEAAKAPPDLRAGTSRDEAELERTLSSLGLL
jgi:hypothetical protein